MNQIKNVSELKFVSKETPLIFKKLRESYKPDVKVQVAEVVINAHKEVLVNASPVLRAMLSNNYWKYEKIIEFKEFIDSSILEDLINYFYTAKITFTQENACWICIASHFLQIPELLTVSEQFLIENLSYSNLEEFWTLSNNFDLKNLQEHCTEYFSSRKYCFRNDEKLLKMNWVQIIQILKKMFPGNKDPRLYEEKFYLVINWVIFDLENRQDYLLRLLEYVPLEKTSLKFLNEVVRHHPLIRYSTLFFILIEAFNEKILTKYSSTFFQYTYLYCLGGESSSECFTPHSSKSSSSLVSRYDPETKKWTTLVEMIIGRAFFSAIAFKEKIYVFGGITKLGITDRCEVFDCKENFWDLIEPMHVPRSHCGVAEYRGDLYVFYGKDSFGRFLNSIERYSIEKNKWKLFQFNSNSIQHELQYEIRFLGIHDDVFYRLLVEKKEISRIDHYMKACIEGFDMNSCRETKSRDVTNLLKLRSIDHIYTTMHDGKIFFQNFEGLSYLHIDTDIPNHISTSNYSPGQCLIFLNNKLLKVGGYNKDSPDFVINISEFDAKKEYWSNYIENIDVPRANHCCVVTNHAPFPRYNDAAFPRSYGETSCKRSKKDEKKGLKNFFQNIFYTFLK